MNFIDRYLNRHIQFEIAPVLIFFITNYIWGLTYAIVAIMFASVLFTILSVSIERKVPVFPIITLILVLSLGGAALVFDNQEFIKIKPTVGLCLFALILFVGLYFRPTLLARALERQVSLSEKGWRVLTFRWILLALFLAIANEIVWRTQDTDTWVVFKTILSLTSIFGSIIITRVTAPKYWQEPDNYETENKT